MSHKSKFSLNSINLAKDIFFRVGVSEKPLIFSKHTDDLCRHAQYNLHDLRGLRKF